MVVGRIVAKKRKKESEVLDDSSQDSPKRTKVHAQRKFAQGSNLSSPALTPVKDKDKGKSNGANVSPSELVPISKRPKTEDFLTFLCLRGTPVLPPSLDFFNLAGLPDSPEEESLSQTPESAGGGRSEEGITRESGREVGRRESRGRSSRPSLPHSQVAKACDKAGANRKAEADRTAAICRPEASKGDQGAVQALKQKYQEQRLLKTRATDINKLAQKVKGRSILMRTRSATRVASSATPVKPRCSEVTSAVSHVKKSGTKVLVVAAAKKKLKVSQPKRMVTRSLALRTPSSPPKSKQPEKRFNLRSSRGEVSGVKEVPEVRMKKDIIKKKGGEDGNGKKSGKSKPVIKKDNKAENKTKKFKSPSSDFSSDDDQPLVKKVKQQLVKPPAKKKANSSVERKAAVVLRRKTRSQASPPYSTHRSSTPRSPSPTRQPPAPSTKSPEPSLSSKRPTRKTKEAAAIYLELIGRKLIANDDDDDDADDDCLSVDSLLDLPRMERRERIESMARSAPKKTQQKKPAPKPAPPPPKKLVPPEKKPSQLQTKADNKQAPLRMAPSATAKKDEPTSTRQASKRRAAEGPPPKPLSPAAVARKKKHDRSAVIAAMRKTMNMVDSPPGSPSHRNLRSSSRDEDSAPCSIPISNAPKANNPEPKKVTARERSVPPLERGSTAQWRQMKVRTGSFQDGPSTSPPTTTMSSNLGKSASESDLRQVGRKSIFLHRREPTTVTDLHHTSTAIGTTTVSTNVTTASTSTAAPFSPEHESSVYAFESEPESSPLHTPFRSRGTKPALHHFGATLGEGEDSKGVRVGALVAANKGGANAVLQLPADLLAKNVSSTSIAVQVNLDEMMEGQYTVLESEVGSSLQHSMECSTQTDGLSSGSGPLFYIPLQAAGGSGLVGAGGQGLGLALKLGTEGTIGKGGVPPRLVMQAKLVTRPPAPVASTSSCHTSTSPCQTSTTASTNAFATASTSTATKKKEISPPPPLLPSPLPPRKAAAGSKGRASKAAAAAMAAAEKAAAAAKATATTKFTGSAKATAAASSNASMLEAPSFFPTEEEFNDPLEYFDKVRPLAEQFGLCRIVPPSSFKPECKVNDNMRFTAYNQYIHKMMHRWGPNVKEMTAIRKYLSTQNISLKQPPWIGGMEVDLPRLYQSVQYFGGLKEVIEKKRWVRVADYMRIPKAAQDRVAKLDDIYCKYLLPYDTLSPSERERLLDQVEAGWKRKSQQEEESDSDDESSEDESEECVVKGRTMPLNAFYRIARNTMSMWFRTGEAPVTEAEAEFWRLVTDRSHHVCVHSGSIDSGVWGYGFPCGKTSPFARHPWNLKVLTNNPGSVLRCMGPVMGVTVPTLHVGMLFTACCWYRDPHALPWVEYLHAGASKVWYGVPESQGDVFRSAMLKLVPRYCKSGNAIWLPSDTAAVPPSSLVTHGVSPSRLVQNPGEFVLVFPRAFTSTICTGYLVSESVYFARPSWLWAAEEVFRDIRDSCEPSVFSLDRLVLGIAQDGRSQLPVLQQVLPMLQRLRREEVTWRKKLQELNLKATEKISVSTGKKKQAASSGSGGTSRGQQQDEVEYECETCRANLYLSMMVCSQEDSTFCLPHAVDWLADRKEQSKGCKLLYTYTLDELNDLVQKVQDKIQVKSQKKASGKSHKKSDSVSSCSSTSSQS